MSRADIIAWMVDCMARHVPEVDQATLQAIEVEARQQWGGQRIDYVPKTMGRAAGRRLPSEVAEAVYRDAIAGVPTDVILGQHGISRSTLYRLVKTGPADGSGET